MTGNGRIVGLDLGAARVGVAVSDPLGITAQPAGFFPRSGPRGDVQEVRALILLNDATRVVIGLPLLLSGESGAKADEAREFAQRLRDALEIEVDLWDERLTTVQAERLLIEGNVRRERRRTAVDAIAAALILQSWLDAHPTHAPTGGDHPST